jgi:hypothetical protein
MASLDKTLLGRIGRSLGDHFALTPLRDPLASGVSRQWRERLRSDPAKAPDWARDFDRKLSS